MYKDLQAFAICCFTKYQCRKIIICLTMTDFYGQTHFYTIHFGVFNWLHHFTLGKL